MVSMGLDGVTHLPMAGHLVAHEMGHLLGNAQAPFNVQYSTSASQLVSGACLIYTRVSCETDFFSFGSNRNKPKHWPFRFCFGIFSERI